MSPNRQVSLEVLRDQIANCNSCFAKSKSAKSCRHHEDLLGGYEKGRIVIVGINPQGREDDGLYKMIEAMPGEHRNRLGDETLRLFAEVHSLLRKTNRAARDSIKLAAERVFGHGTQLSALHFHAHKGLRTWLPRVVRCLDTTPEVLRDHVSMVEAVKHTTSDQTALHQSEVDADQCHSWLTQQLAHLEPAGVVFTGGTGEQLALKLGVVKAATSLPSLHGTRGTWRPAGSKAAIDVLFTYAFSQRNDTRWKTSPATAEVQTWFRERIQRRLRAA